ncbi:MAG: alpha/beta hydrolase [Pseudomonadota bacterium]
MELDDAYANMTHIPKGSSYPDIWAKRAFAFRAALADRAVLGQPYGASPRQAYDLFLPGQTPLGTVIFVHGGYWYRFDKSSWSHLAAGALTRGWAVAMPSYDLCPSVGIPDITKQVARAIDAIAAQSDAPIALSGHSAGGQLVARCLSRGMLKRSTLQRISHAAILSPVGDLRPLLKTSMNATLGLDAKTAISESPTLASRPAHVEVSIWVGEEERPAFLDQAQQLGAAWDVDVRVVSGRHHFDIISLLEAPETDLVQRLTA